jgi:hypothetical protein
MILVCEKTRFEDERALSWRRQYMHTQKTRHQARRAADAARAADISWEADVRYRSVTG